MLFTHHILKRNLCLILSLIIVINFAQAQSEGSLRNNIQELLKEQKLSGAVWATVLDNGEILTDTAGFKNMQTKEILEQHTKVHVGSVAKTIVAAAFLRMATLGMLDIDDPIKKYLANLPLKNPWHSTSPVTLRHLLDHRSGLTDAKLWHIFSTTAQPNTPLETVYKNSPEILTVQEKPGTIYSYSNLGYTILGMVIEKITQSRYEKYLDENFLKPLGMVNSSFEFITQNTDPQLAYGHFDNGEPVAAIPMYLRPAGQLTTTAEDMGKFLRFMMSDGSIDGRPFIKQELLSNVGKQNQTDAFKNGVPYGDALGAYSRDRYGVVGIAKNGNILGFTSMIYMFPKEKKAFFIAYNMDSETANYDLFNEVLTKHFNLPFKSFLSKAESTEKEIKNWNGYYVPIITKVQPFGLLDYVFSHTKVETTFDGALLEPFQGKAKTLIYQKNQLFSMKDRTNISHAFYINSNNEYVITDGIKTIKKESGIKIIAIGLSLVLGLMGMLYLFVSGCIKMIKFKLDFKRQTNLMLFASIVILVCSIILLANQPFIRMGDKTFGNILLALATTFIPVFSLYYLFLALKKKNNFPGSLNFWVVLFVFQFSVLLMANKLMPIFMWK